MQGDLTEQAGGPVTGALADALGSLDMALTDDTWRVPEGGLV